MKALRLLDVRVPERLRGVTAEFESGQVIGLLGPNGAGKTTLLRLIAGLYGSRFGGKVESLGSDLRDSSTSEWARRTAYIPADLNCEFPLTVREYVALGGYRKPVSVPEVDAALARCGISDFQARNVQSLSDGERQKVQIARALVQDPKIFILDEALSRLDLDQRPKFGRLLKDLAKSGALVLWVAHEAEFLQKWSDEIVLMRQGECVARVPAAEALRPEILAKAYPGLGQVDD